jgi:hypothetical protein
LIFRDKLSLLWSLVLETGIGTEGQKDRRIQSIRGGHCCYGVSQRRKKN